MPPVVKKPKIRQFRQEWLKCYPWLTHNAETGMHCTFCTKHKMKNVYVSGNKDYQNSSLLRHQISDMHQQALKLNKLSENLEKGVETLQNQSVDKLIPQLRTVMFLCKENIALDKFLSIIELQQQNGAPITGNNNKLCCIKLLNLIIRNLNIQFKYSFYFRRLPTSPTH
jgi:hypothetical protein